MHRRTLLRAGLVGSASTLGGCAFGSSNRSTNGNTTSPPAPSPAGETPPSTAVDTRSSTTRTLYEPTVVDAHLVSTWAESGDLVENRAETVARGRPAVVAFRYAVRLPAGRFRFREEVAVRGPDGSHFARRRVEVAHTAESAGTAAWEHALAFETAGWPLGECTATVTVGNLELHRVSAPTTTSFRVVPE